LDQSNHPQRPDPLTPAAPADGTSAPDANGTPPANGPLPPPPASSASPVNTFIYLLLISGVIWLFWKFGWDGVVRGAMVVVGLGFLIFIHELGHFLAAKWCDVHVQTFSIGFGPALPGCSFTRGETTYKVAVIPLGGYVNMVGEGPEADEDEDYPRSFKNKTVLQRMLIISAGVIMNVLFGAICFVVVYFFHGMEQPPAIVWSTEPGSPAWKAGVRPGWEVVRLNGKPVRYFRDLQRAVVLSPGGRSYPFDFEALPGMPSAPAESIDLEPFRDKNNSYPVIGVRPPISTKLLPKQARRQHSIPVLYDSAAASARVLELSQGDVPVAVIDPKSEAVTQKLPSGPAGWKKLCELLRKLEPDEQLTLRVRGAGGKTRDVEVAGAGFEFGDSVEGTTDPATPDDPYNIAPLPPDPSQPSRPTFRNAFALRDRMRQLAGKPMVFQVRRQPAKEGQTAEVVHVLVPPAYHWTFGMRMEMGKVAAIRENSPATKGVQEDDVIIGASLRYDKKGPWEPLPHAALDPLRLPWELTRRVHADAKRDPGKWEVKFTVERTVNHKKDAKVETPPLPWDDGWKLGEEGPVSPAAPMSIPQLGIAYWVECTVASVKEKLPAARAGLEKGDVITHIRYREAGKTPQAAGNWGNWVETFSIRGKEKPRDQWAYFSWMVGQYPYDYPRVEVKVLRGGKEAGPFEMTAEEDRDWPSIQRGLIFRSDYRLQKTDSILEAVGFGMSETWQFIEQIYLNLTGLLSGRISSKTLGGPLTIATQAFGIAGEDVFVFLLYLGIISINLAVVNFLPIPVLDGGHMVFLTYEGIRGKPPSERVRAWATYLGLLFILLLMLFVLGLDAKRVWPNYFSWLPFGG
jgi:regulator of sigma E protease